MPHAYLITGANRGIGLELARQLKEAKNIVIGTARDPSDAGELTEIADRVEQLDVSDGASCAALGKALAHVPIDVLINNAGQSPEPGGLADVDPEALDDHLSVNAVGAVRVTRAVLPALRAASEKKVINMSSELGSIADCHGNYYAYRMGKAALNMFTATLASELNGEGFTVVSMHPGWVRTRMGGPSAPVDVVDSAKGLIDGITHMTQENNGGYFDYTGAAMRW
jgi:NAD(P)-dependent dehydrogenase (short-subunit alcohol dehydrogenase family)